ncbi:hypothetical protein FIM12_07835 [SAR202 cluster bacterium AD-804-J14_MRT_500m]|nr:hypothetical protein [SAR202 cluster bacterium AD-804-J14_MRT_500m]
MKCFKTRFFHYNTWYYGSSTVSFNYSGFVDGWSNAGNLNLTPASTPSGTFTLGSSEQDVLDTQGNPSSIYYTTWYYDSSTVSFNYSGFVDGWSNAGNLNLTPASTPSGTFTLGSSEQDVLDTQGNPSSIYYTTWYYDSSTVSFNYSGFVDGWSNAGNLNLTPASTPSGTFTLGSSEQDVLDTQGNPSSIYYNTWYYGSSTVSFNYSGFVDGWSNAGNLNIGAP